MPPISMILPTLSKRLPTPVIPEKTTILTDKLRFDFGGPEILKDIDLSLEAGSRCLLVGANGAGKSTLLRCLAGKRLVKTGGVYVLGQNAFHDGPAGVTYLGTEWASNPIVRRDVPVWQLVKSCGGERFPERAKELMRIMDVRPTWRMHAVSDGQRRRVQIILGLLQPWRVLLLDEVTVDLDVIVRKDLLSFLKAETATGATVVYATHIFDGLSDWPTHVVHMRDGKIQTFRNAENFPELDAVKHKDRFDSCLLLVVEQWLREDLNESRRLRAVAARAESKEEGGPTLWDDLKDDMKTHGDKYYDYWTRE